jgi:two-component system response regulator PilR (NtrC family)
VAEPRVLVVEDEAAQRTLLTALLQGKGYAVAAAEGVGAARRLLDENAFDAVVTDLQMPDGSGLDVLATARRLDADVGVVVVTAYGTVPVAVEAMRGGAFDVLLKPVDPDALLAVVRRCVEHRDLRRENERLRARITSEMDLAGVVAQSPAMRRVLDTVRRVAPTSATVLVTGESGTGKERVANLLHQHGPTPKGPFVAVNCAALPEGLLESELFGHAKGAFTGAVRERPGRFEEADGGTIFLDEIGEIPLAAQVRLLRVLQEREVVRVGENRPRPVRVRVVAATNRDLEADVRAGRFREDLYYRVHVVRIHLPPLRERPEDVEPLVERFAREAARRHGRTGLRFAPAALDALRAHPFPGNVRELQNVVERAVLLAEGPLVGVESLPDEVVRPREAAEGGDDAPPGGGLDAAVEALERRLLRAALARANGVQTRAAGELGIDERVLRYKMKKYGLRRDGE